MTKALAPFTQKECPWPDRVLSQRELTGANSLGIGPAGDEHFTLRDGRMFRIADEHETPHAVLPRTTQAHPLGIPLRAVRIEDMHDEDYAALVAQLPEPPRAAAEYSWKQPMGAGGHERTDEPPRAEA